MKTLEKHAWLVEAGAARWNLDAIHPNRQRYLARVGRAAEPQMRTLCMNPLSSGAESPLRLGAWFQQAASTSEQFADSWKRPSTTTLTATTCGDTVRNVADLFKDLAEARIADWKRREAAGEVRRDQKPLEMDRIENQLFKEILVLFERARGAEGDARDALLREANKLRMQMIIGLEKTNPLAAKQLDDRLAAARPR